MGAVSPDLKVLDRVKLKVDQLNVALSAGAPGTIVNVLDDSKGFEVEFDTAQGKTVLTLDASQIEPATSA